MYADPGGSRGVTPQGPRSLHFRGMRPIPRLPKLASSSARLLARPLSATCMPALGATYLICSSANAMFEFVFAIFTFVVHHTVVVPMHTAMLAIVSRAVLVTLLVALLPTMLIIAARIALSPAIARHSFVVHPTKPPGPAGITAAFASYSRSMPTPRQEKSSQDVAANETQCIRRHGGA